MKNKIVLSLLTISMLSLTACSVKNEPVIETKTESTLESSIENTLESTESISLEEKASSDIVLPEEEKPSTKEKKEVNLSDVTFKEYNKNAETSNFSTIFIVNSKDSFARMKADISYLSNIEKDGLSIESTIQPVETNGGKNVKYRLSNDEDKYEFELNFKGEKLSDKSKALNDDYITSLKEDALKTINKKYSKGSEKVDLSLAKVFNDDSFTQFAFINNNYTTIKYNAKKDKYSINEEIIDKENKISFSLELTDIPASLFEDVLTVVQNAKIESVTLFDDCKDSVKITADDMVITFTYDGEINIGNYNNENTGINAVQFGLSTTVLENNHDYKNTFIVSIPNDDTYSWISTGKFEDIVNLAKETNPELSVVEKENMKIVYDYYPDMALILIKMPHAYGQLSEDRDNILIKVSSPYNGDLTKSEKEELKDFISKLHFSAN